MIEPATLGLAFVTWGMMLICLGIGYLMGVNNARRTDRCSSCSMTCGCCDDGR